MFLSYLAYITGAALLFIAIIHIIYQKRSSASMISWFLFLILIPPVAVPLYFVIGIRKRTPSHLKEELDFKGVVKETHAYNPSEHAIASILEKNGIPPATFKNDFILISDDIKAFETMMRSIKNAKKSIDFATFVFTYDATTKTILKALEQKAREGVHIRLLLDTMGSFGAYIFQKHYFSSLKKAGGHVEFFSPPLKKLFQSYINLRNHRKIYIFDQHIVLSGGMNLSDQYFGAEQKSRWSDLLYELKGPSVYVFQAVFESDWAYATQTSVEKIRFENDHFEGTDFVQVVPSGPDIPQDPFYEALLNAIYNAKERIWITTPYFVPDENILQALIIAAHKGVDVRLITPRYSDNKMADLVRASYMRELYKYGISLWLYEKQMLHAKAIIIDRIGGMVGSLNLDNRSLFLNYEIVSFVYSKGFIQTTEQWMESLMQNSTNKLYPAGKIRQALENIAKIFAPMV